MIKYSKALDLNYDFHNDNDLHNNIWYQYVRKLHFLNQKLIFTCTVNILANWYSIESHKYFISAIPINGIMCVIRWNHSRVVEFMNLSYADQSCVQGKSSYHFVRNSWHPYAASALHTRQSFEQHVCASKAPSHIMKMQASLSLNMICCHNDLNYDDYNGSQLHCSLLLYADSAIHAHMQATGRVPRQR